MSLLNLFRFRHQSSASIAKERLQIIVAHERVARRQGIVNLQELQQKLIHVIAEYLNVSESEVKVQLERNADRSVLELNVTLPDTVPQTASA